MSIEKIHTILESWRVTKETNQHYNLVGVCLPTGRFNMDIRLLDEFWHSYCSYVKKTADPAIGLAEILGSISPVLVDIDLKVPYTSDEQLTGHLYTEQQLLRVISTYQEVIRDVVKDVKHTDLLCFVLEKDPYRSKNHVKNGFHLHFPLVYLRVTEIQAYIIPKVSQLLRERNVFQSLGYEDSGKCVDDAVCRNPWLLYGSKKSADSKAYRLTAIYDSDLKPVKLKDALKKIPIYDTNEKLIDMEGHEEFYLPRVLSLCPVTRRGLCLDVRPSVKTIFGDKINAAKQAKSASVKTSKNDDDGYDEMTPDSIEKNLKDARSLLTMMKDDRADNRNDWMTVMWALHHCSKGSEKGLELFLEFSQRSDKYHEGECRNLWENHTHKEGGNTLGTIDYFAEEDNPEAHRDWKASSNKKKDGYNRSDFDTMLSDFNQSDVARWYHERNPAKYLLSKNTGWYEYNRFNVLIQAGKKAPSSLHNDITLRIQDEIIKHRNSLKPSKDKDEEYDRKMKAVKSAYIKVGNAGFVKGVIEFLEGYYTIDQIDQKFDDTSSIIAFDDMAYDIVLGKFRAIQPQDYITKTTRRPAPRAPVSPALKSKVDDLLWSIFENKEVIEYWWTTVGLSLFGNKSESLFIHTGAGGNGKGLLNDIIRQCIGDYFLAAEGTFLTSSFKAGQANPTLASCKGIRYLFVPEIDDTSDTGKDRKLNVPFIKQMTGGDTITTRALYQDNISFLPQFTCFLQCNEKPQLGKIDNGIKRRLHIVNYPFNFVEKDKIRGPQDKLANSDLKHSLTTDFLDAFTLTLLDYAQRFYRVDMKHVQKPEAVERETSEYFDDNNPLKSWLAENTDASIPDSKIKSSELLARYNEDAGFENKVSAVKFAEMMKFNGFEKFKSCGLIMFKGLKLRQKTQTYEEIHLD
jgi:P4 family phage/plasmid primase-like protien